MDRRELEDMIYVHLRPCLDAWIIYLREPHLAGRAGLMTGQYVTALLDTTDGDPDAAGRALTAAKNILQARYPDEVPEDFWGTPLGQVLFGAGAFPSRSASMSEAQHVLRITRQGVSYLRQRNILVYAGFSTGKPGVGVTRDSLYRRWQATRP